MERSIIDTVRGPLAGLGIAAVLVGIGYLLISGQFDLVPRILVAAGILLIGVYVALDPADVWARVTTRSALYSGNVIVVAIAAVAILGLLNVVGSRYQTKWDLTANQQYTLSAQSQQVAANLPDTVQVTGYFTPQDATAKTQFETRLNDYIALSNGKLTYSSVDPQANPSAAVAAGVTQDGTVIYQQGSKKQTSTATTEQDITTSLIKVTRPSKVAYFTIGHGERNLSGSDNAGYSQLKQTLQNDNFTVNTLSLATTRTIPDDADEVIVAGPTSPFLPEEMDALRAYLDGGGKLMLLMDPQSQANFNDLLQPWQVSISGGVVVDPRASFQDPRVPVVTTYGTQAATTNLSLATFYPVTTSLTMPASPVTGVTQTAIAQTSAQSYLAPDLQSIQQSDSDATGPFTIVLSLEQAVQGASPSATPAAGATPAPTATASAQSPATGHTRVFVFGTSLLVANQFLSIQSGNSDLFVNAADWLANQDDLISIRAPSPQESQLLLTGTQLNWIKYSSIFFLPLAVLAVGVGMWWARR